MFHFCCRFSNRSDRKKEMDLLLFLLPELSDRKTCSNCPSLTMKMEISHNPDLEEDVHFLKKQQELGLRQAKVFQAYRIHSLSQALLVQSRRNVHSRVSVYRGFNRKRKPYISQGRKHV